MRLVCPNCGAQYDVADEAIPAAGRDVQCSNCNHSWFASRTPLEADDPQDDQVEDAAAPAAPPNYHGLDPQVAAVLQEEAEREARAREAERRAGLETQTEMGLSPSPYGQPDDPHVEIRTIDETFDDAPAPAAQSEQFPDVEGINSTLRADPPAQEYAFETDPMAGVYAVETRRRGFRWGFGLTVVIAIVLGVSYFYAAEIIAQLPQAEPMLTSYVSTVDDLRLWLDGLVSPLLGQLTGSES